MYGKLKIKHVKLIGASELIEVYHWAKFLRINISLAILVKYETSSPTITEPMQRFLEGTVSTSGVNIKTFIEISTAIEWLSNQYAPRTEL